MNQLKQGTSNQLKIEHLKTNFSQNQYHLDKTEANHDQTDFKCLSEAKKID